MKLTQSFPHEENISWLPLLNILLFVKFRHAGGLRFVVSAQRHTEKNGNLVTDLLHVLWVYSNLVTTVHVNVFSDYHCMTESCAGGEISLTCSLCFRLSRKRL